MGRMLLCNFPYWNVWGAVTLGSGDYVPTIYMRSCANCQSLMLNLMENHLCRSEFEERTRFKYLMGFLAAWAHSVLHLEGRMSPNPLSRLSCRASDAPAHWICVLAEGIQKHQGSRSFSFPPEFVSEGKCAFKHILVSQLLSATVLAATLLPCPDFIQFWGDLTEPCRCQCTQGQP